MLINKCIYDTEFVTIVYSTFIPISFKVYYNLEENAIYGYVLEDNASIIICQSLN